MQEAVCLTSIILYTSVNPNSKAFQLGEEISDPKAIRI